MSKSESLPSFVPSLFTKEQWERFALFHKRIALSLTKKRVIRLKIDEQIPNPGAGHLSSWLLSSACPTPWWASTPRSRDSTWPRMSWCWPKVNTSAPGSPSSPSTRAAGLSYSSLNFLRNKKSIFGCMFVRSLIQKWLGCCKYGDVRQIKWKNNWIWTYFQIFIESIIWGILLKKRQNTFI